MRKKKQVKEIVSDSISRLTIPYIEKYGNKILGVYLCPYQIGGLQRIEVVILHNTRKEIPVIKNQILVNELKIQVSIKPIDEYRGSINSEKKEKIARELKSSAVIYDPKKFLNKKITLLQQNEKIPKFYNSFELPNEVVKITKRKVYSRKRDS